MAPDDEGGFGGLYVGYAAGPLKDVSSPEPDDVWEPVSTSDVENPVGARVEFPKVGNRYRVEELEDISPPPPDEVGKLVGPTEVRFAELGSGYGVLLMPLHGVLFAELRYPPVPDDPAEIEAK